MKRQIASYQNPTALSNIRQNKNKNSILNIYLSNQKNSSSVIGPNGKILSSPGDPPKDRYDPAPFQNGNSQMRGLLPQGMPSRNQQMSVDYQNHIMGIGNRANIIYGSIHAKQNIQGVP